MSEELIKANKNLLAKLLKGRNISISINESLSSSSVNSLDLDLTIDEILILIKTNDENIQLKVSEACRKMLSKKCNLPISDMISNKIVPFCIEFLKPQYSFDIQFEACWAITNIAGGTPEQTQYVIQQGAIPLLIELLKSSSLKVVEQAAWALGNIAVDSPRARYLVLKEDVLPLLAQIITPKIPVSIVSIIVWTLSNLCCSVYPLKGPSFETFYKILPVLNNLLSYSDKKVLGDTCRALSYLTEGPSQNIQAVIECGIVPKIIKLLISQEFIVLKYALQTVSHITTGTDSQIDLLIAQGSLRYLRDLLYHKNISIVRQAVWTISNITAKSFEQIQHIIDNDIIMPLIEAMNKEDLELQMKAAWAMRNITSKGTVIQILNLVQKKFLKPFCDLLMTKNLKCVLFILESIYNILNAAQKMAEMDRVAFIIREVGGVAKLRKLQNNENLLIRHKTSSIIDLYFSKTLVLL